MNLRSRLRRTTLGASLTLATLLAGSWFPGGAIISDAEARIGRPMTPVSVAGVARRTTRRTIRRTAGLYSFDQKACVILPFVFGNTQHQKDWNGYDLTV